MKRFMYLVAALTIASATAQARLGQTVAEVEKQYGKPTAAPYPVEYVNRNYGDTQAWYEMQDLKILVVFKNGKSQLETIAKKDTTENLTRSEVTAYLTANSGGSTWTIPKNLSDSITWDRDDGGARATITNDRKSLTIRITSGGSKNF